MWVLVSILMVIWLLINPLKRTAVNYSCIQLMESVRCYVTFNKLSSYHSRAGDINKFQAYILHLHVFLVDQPGQKVC